MPKRLRQDEDDAASGHPLEGVNASTAENAGRRRKPPLRGKEGPVEGSGREASPAGSSHDEAVMRLGRIVGRQIAREQFEGDGVTQLVSLPKKKAP